jgi:hypothetical protein
MNDRYRHHKFPTAENAASGFRSNALPARKGG